MSGTRLKSPLIWLLLAAAVLYLLGRGPYRAVHETVDLPTFYGGTRAWVLGEDPYDHATVKRLYDEAGGDGQHVARCVNPPSFFPVMAPLGLPPYQAAKLGMIGLSLAALGVALWAIGGLPGVVGGLPGVVGGLPGVGGRAGEQKSGKAEDQGSGIRDQGSEAEATQLPGAYLLLLIAAACALAPVQTTISQGQHGLLVLMLLGLALRAEVARREVWVGVCLALAAALKPQMVVLFGFYYLMCGRWVVVAAGALGTAALLGVGIGRMELAGIDWLGGLRDNLAAFTGPVRDPVDMSGAANYTAMGDGRYIMVDLAAWLHSFTNDATIIRVTRVLVGGAIVGLAAWFTAPWKQSRGASHETPDPDTALTTYALLATGCLVCAYNRYYAATVLVLAVAVGLRLLARERKAMGGLILAGCAVFFVPGVAVLLRLQRGALDGHVLPQTWLWDELLLPHQVYTLIALAVLLAIALRRASCAPAAVKEDEADR